jgi:hypothetical protein
MFDAETAYSHVGMGHIPTPSPSRRLRPPAASMTWTWEEWRFPKSWWYPKSSKSWMTMTCIETTMVSGRFLSHGGSPVVTMVVSILSHGLV